MLFPFCQEKLMILYNCALSIHLYTSDQSPLLTNCGQPPTSQYGAGNVNFDDVTKSPHASHPLMISSVISNFYKSLLVLYYNNVVCCLFTG